MDMARINGSFGTKDDIIELAKSVDVPVLLDIPRNRTKKRTNEYSDRELVRLAIENKFEFIGVSYVKQASDIWEVREYASPDSINIIAKVETEEALHNLESIINASDGIMIDRGDLASAIGVENLPRFQKKIITECNYAAKPVIVATEMLMSMVENKEPTKAEILDIANAVADGADFVMLSEETAVGKYPEHAIEVLKKVIGKVENKYKILILAAGGGAGLGSLTADKPACLVDVGGQTIIEHQLENLKNCGINEEDIIIATGKAENKIREYLHETDVHVTFNPWWENSNILTTVWLAKDQIKQGCIILYGDIVFDKHILAELLQRKEDIVLCVDRNSGDEEAEKVVVKDGLLSLSKKYEDLPTPKHKCIPPEEAYGEFIGLAKFSRYGSIQLIIEMDRIMRKYDFKSYLVYAFEQLAKKGFPCHVLDIGDRMWNDNDNIEDIHRTRDIIFPKIKINEKNGGKSL